MTRETTQPGSPYPVRFNVAYPDGPQDRLKVLLRIIYAIPILVIASVIGGAAYNYGPLSWLGQGGILIFGPALMIVFRRRYPRWWFDFNVALMKFEARVFAYLALLREEYPSTTDEQAAILEVDYPDVDEDLDRYMPLFKWLLAIPHYIVLAILGLFGIAVVIAAWFVLLFTGRYPRSFFDYVVGVMRWNMRVQGYAFVMVTDRYPPFSME